MHLFATGATKAARMSGFDVIVQVSIPVSVLSATFEKS